MIDKFKFNFRILRAGWLFLKSTLKEKLLQKILTSEKQDTLTVQKEMLDNLDANKLNSSAR